MIDAARIAEGKWWQRPWSLVDWCTPVSEGCENCWARAMARRFKPGISRVIPRSDRLDIPPRVRKPTLWAVWNDLFHEDVSAAFIRGAHGTICNTPQHHYAILTKRPQRIIATWDKLKPTLPNAWLGTTVENQEHEWRIGELLKYPASLRFLSLEPLLGPIDFTAWTTYLGGALRPAYQKLHWVIVGGESGSKRRPCKLEWVESVVGQCRVAGVPVFVKQLHLSGTVVSDMAHPQWPTWAVREMPAGVEVR